MWTLFGATSTVSLELILASGMVALIAYLLTNDVKLSAVVGLVQALASFSVTCALRSAPPPAAAPSATPAPSKKP